MTPQRRWLKSVLEAARQPQPTLPWQRGLARGPVTAPPRPRVAAAR